MRDKWRTVTRARWGDVDELRSWLRENIGRAYEDWSTWGSSTSDHVGVTVYNEQHLTLVALRWV
jgi:hypothetical protein